MKMIIKICSTVMLASAYIILGAAARFDPLSATAEAAGTIYVNWHYSGKKLGTPSRPFNTVKEAHDSALAGSQIQVQVGSYPELLTFSKQVTLTAQGGNAIVGQVFGTNPHKSAKEGYVHTYKGQTHAHANVCTYHCYLSYDPNDCMGDPGPCWVCKPDPVWGVFYCEKCSPPPCGPKQYPPDLEEAYRIAGYAFLALTHHEVIIPDPGVQRILHINGEEDGDWWWPYNPIHILGVDISSPSNSTDWTCQERIDHYLNQNGVAIIAHPNDNLDQDYDDDQCVGSGGHLLKDLSGYTGAEIPANPDLRLWDDVLSTGGIMWAFAADDCHDVTDAGQFNKRWIEVHSNKFPIDRADIIKNIKAGNFFSVWRGDQKTMANPTSPELEMGVDNITKKMTVAVLAMDQAQSCQVRFIGGDQRLLKSVTVNSPGSIAEYVWTGAEGGYIRVEAEDNLGWTTFSQPIKCRK
jgi:hypothetical protein